jgi:hypothetical protein
MADDINSIQPTSPLPVSHPVSDEDKPASQEQHKNKKNKAQPKEEKPRPKEDDKGEFIDEYV